MPSDVSAVPAAAPAEAEAHFAAEFAFETGCWDVHDALAGGAPDVVLLDARAPAMFARPYAWRGQPAGGQACREQAGRLACRHRLRDLLRRSALQRRGALRLARLGRPVQIMAGGITGWLDEGFELATEAAPA